MIAFYISYPSECSSVISQPSISACPSHGCVLALLPVVPRWAQCCVAGADSKATAVQLRQLNSRWGFTLIHCIRSSSKALNGPAHRLQRPNISPIVPWREAGFKGMAGEEDDVQQLFFLPFLFVRPWNPTKHSNNHHWFCMCSDVCICVFVFVFAPVLVCVMVSLTKVNSAGFTLALSEIKVFVLLSLFSSSHCGRVDEKWEIDWGCVKVLKVNSRCSHIIL